MADLEAWSSGIVFTLDGGGALATLAGAAAAPHMPQPNAALASIPGRYPR
jgi:hypothetical protein